MIAIYMIVTIIKFSGSASVRLLIKICLCKTVADHLRSIKNGGALAPNIDKVTFVQSHLSYLN